MHVHVLDSVLWMGSMYKVIQKSIMYDIYVCYYTGIYRIYLHVEDYSSLAKNKSGGHLRPKVSSK